MTATYFSTGTASTAWIYYTSSTSSTTTNALTFGNDNVIRTVNIPDTWDSVYKTLHAGNDYILPDGAILKLDHVGNYLIEDLNSKVTYRANRVREFNPYINASDLLEDFVRNMKEFGVKQSELLNLPVNIFVHWLILKAAERDGDDISDVESPFRLVSPNLLEDKSNEH